MTMLACARLGAPHSVVFAGFSAEALAQRIVAANSRFLATADRGLRGGKTIPLKDIVDEARSQANCEATLEKVLVFEHSFDETREAAPYDVKPKDVRMDVLVAGKRPYCPPEWVDSEDILFLLYTSGTSGILMAIQLPQEFI